MKQTLLTLMLCSLTGAGLAAEKEVSVEGQVISYIKSASLSTEGKLEVTPNTVFVGERILRSDEGLCMKETSTLLGMNTSESNGMKIQLPELNIRRVQTNCPA